MDRLESFEKIFVNIMLALCVGLLFGAAFGFNPFKPPANSLDVFSWDWKKIVLYLLFLSFIVKYLQALSVLRFRLKCCDGNLKETSWSNILLFGTRVIFLASLYLLIVFLFPPDQQAPLLLIKIVFLVLLIFGYALPSISLIGMVDKQDSSLFLESLNPVIPKKTLKDVFQT